MLFYQINILTILFASIFSSLNQRPNDTRPQGSDHYNIIFSAENKQLVKVKATLILQDSLLQMSQNGPLPERWPQFVSNINAYDESGKSITLTNRDSTAWLIDDSFIGKKISLEYELNVQHEDYDWPGGIDGVAFVKDYGVMLSGRSLFIVNGENKEHILLDISIPSGWKITTPWKSTENSYQFVAHNLTQLKEALIFAGTHEEMNIERKDFTLKFVLGGEKIINQSEQYSKVANTVLDYYIDLMGDVPRPNPENDFSSVVVMINQSENVDGEVIGNNISMFMNPEAGMQDQIFGWFMFAHEFFHLWNGKSLVFEDTSTEWFKEGVTCYYTFKALHHAGLADENVVGAVMNALFYNRYVNDPGYGKLAPANAASGFDKDNHWGIIYGGGMFAGMCMDLEIRNNTQNQESLDDLMRYFFNTHAGTAKTISNDALVDYANNIGNTDFASFMKHYIHGTDEVPLDKYMKYAGVEVTYENNQMKLNHSASKNEFQQQVWSGFLGKN